MDMTDFKLILMLGTIYGMPLYFILRGVRRDLRNARRNVRLLIHWKKQQQAWNQYISGVSIVVAVILLSSCGSGTKSVVPPLDPSLTTSVVGPGKILQTPEGSTFNSGTEITLTATPNSGANFSGWSGGSCSGTSAVCALTLDANSTVTATFADPSSTGDSTPPALVSEWWSFGEVVGSASQHFTPTAGHGIVAIIWMNCTPGTTLKPITDKAGDSFVQVSEWNFGDTSEVSVFYALNAVGGVSDLNLPVPVFPQGSAGCSYPDKSGNYFFGIDLREYSPMSGGVDAQTFQTFANPTLGETLSTSVVTNIANETVISIGETDIGDFNDALLAGTGESDFTGVISSYITPGEQMFAVEDAPAAIAGSFSPAFFVGGSTDLQTVEGGPGEVSQIVLSIY